MRRFSPGFIRGPGLAITPPVYQSSGTPLIGSSTALTSIPLPAGIAAGDLLLMIAAVSVQFASMVAPAGWTLYNSYTPGGAYVLYAWYKFATASEVAPTVTYGGSNVSRFGQIHRFSNVNPTTPFGAFTFETFNLTPAQADSITTTQANSLALGFGYVYQPTSGFAWTAPAPWSILTSNMTLGNFCGVLWGQAVPKAGTATGPAAQAFSGTHNWIMFTAELLGKGAA